LPDQHFVELGSGGVEEGDAGLESNGSISFGRN
jgi:hypothetical protein